MEGSNSLLRYSLLRSEWAIDLRSGLEYLNELLFGAEIYGSQEKYIEILEARKEKSHQVVMNYGFQLAEEVSGSAKELKDKNSLEGVAVMNLSGPMRLDGDLCSYGMRDFTDDLLALESDDSVKAVLLRVNSGGGEVDAGQLVYNTIRDFSKPVGALVTLAASAAYMAIAPADVIMSEGTTPLIGSIGVLYTVDKAQIAYVRDNIETVYSDLSEDKGAIEQGILRGDYGPLKKLMNATAKEFQNMVVQERFLSYKKSSTLKGGLFMSEEARKRGLIDMIGSYKAAINYLLTNF